MKLSPPDLVSLANGHPEAVKAAIRMRGETLAGLSRKNGYSDHYIGNTLIRPLLQGERIIAKVLGLQPHQIWPDRYDAKGRPDHRKWRRIARLRGGQVRSAP